MEKLCPKCKINLPIIHFYKSKITSSGFRSWCKNCEKKANIVREPYYKEARRLYRINNQVEYRENKKKYYIKNKESFNEQSKKWYHSLKGKFVSYQRNAKTRNIIWNLTIEEFEKFWQKSCFYCNDPIITIGLDRINSLKEYSIENIVPCCKICNRMKMNDSKEDFLHKIKTIYKNLNL